MKLTTKLLKKLIKEEIRKLDEGSINNQFTNAMAAIEISLERIDTLLSASMKYYKLLQNAPEGEEQWHWEKKITEVLGYIEEEQEKIREEKEIFKMHGTTFQKEYDRWTPPEGAPTLGR
jgi:trehalose/maltose hydrolase-like predicted phosphorylase